MDAISKGHLIKWSKILQAENNDINNKYEEVNSQILSFQAKIKVIDGATKKFYASSEEEIKDFKQIYDYYLMKEEMEKLIIQRNSIENERKTKVHQNKIIINQIDYEINKLVFK